MYMYYVYVLCNILIYCRHKFKYINQVYIFKYILNIIFKVLEIAETFLIF